MRSLLHGILLITLQFLFIGCYNDSRPVLHWDFVPSHGDQVNGRMSYTQLNQNEKPWDIVISNRSGLLTVRNRRGQIVRHCGIKSGRLHGIFRHWYNNGQLMEENEYQNGELHGLSKTWFANGQLQGTANYVNGLAHGTRTNWFFNGQIKSIIESDNGLLHGIIQSWNENGDQIEDGNFRYHKRWNGTIIIYKKRDQHPLVGVYSNGLLISQHFWSPK